MDLPERFRRHLATLPLPGRRCLVAVSGGPDSVVLLDLLVRARDLHAVDLVVAHFDHAIHPDSGRVADRVRALAESLGLPFEIGRGVLGAAAGETAARTARYAWIEVARVRSGAACVLTGHHADDQIETVLMRALAGSGVAGLAGMAAVRGTIVRPLLPFRREQLLRHLRQSRLSAWVDPANADPRHLRSWVRAELLPVVRARLPEVDRQLERLARHAASDRAAWDGVLDLLPGLDLRSEVEGISVAASRLAGYDSSLAQAVLRAAARRVGCQLGPARVARVLALAQTGASGAQAPLGAGWKAELAFGRLGLHRECAETPAPAWVLDGHQGRRTWGRWTFRWQRVAAPEQRTRGGLTAWFTPGSLTVRPWSAGEKLRPLGGTGRRLLVRCFQDARVPRSRRAEWPVLAGPDGVVWVPGVCRSDALLPAPGTEAVRIDAEYA